MNSISGFHSIACIISNDERKLLVWQHTTCKQITSLILPCFQIIQFLLRHLRKITSRFIRQILKHNSNRGNQLPRVCNDCRGMRKVNSFFFDFRHCRRNIFLDIATEICYLSCSVILSSLYVISKIYVAVIAKAICKLTTDFYQLSEHLIQFFITVILCH